MPRQDKDKIGQEVASQLGLYRNFFQMMRKDNPEKLAYIQAFHTDLVSAYPLFEQHRLDITNRACDIYYELEDSGEILAFGRFLVAEGVYTNDYSYYQTSSTIFSANGVNKFASLLCLVRSNELYWEFRNVSQKRA